MNEIIQTLQFNVEDNVRASQRVPTDSLNPTDLQSFLTKIHQHHCKIHNYWQLYQDLVKANNHFMVLSPDSEVLLTLVVIKLIKSNQTILEYV